MVIRVASAVLALLALPACGRNGGVPDQELGGLVIAAKPNSAPIDVARAAHDPAELGRALRKPLGAVIAALGPHSVTLSTDTAVLEGGKPVSDLSDATSIELGDKGAFHAINNNSADYGREVIYVADMLYLRPRYQRWHGREPESFDEPAQVRDRFYEAIAATWELVEPGAELSDLGATQVAGRSGRKIAVKLAPTPRAPAAEPLAQRKWRETRTVDVLSGEIVIDADKAVPLAVTLAGVITFHRDGRTFAMKLSLTSSVASVGTAAAIAAPAATDVVATPERLREVDDRDFLLQGIAPPTKAKP